MLPNKNHAKWASLISGANEYHAASISAAMCISRNRRHYAKTPDKATLDSCVDDLYRFFEQFEGVLSEDISAIFGS